MSDAATVGFPILLWDDLQVTFRPATESENEVDGIAPVAALVFARRDGRFLLADIAGRGWCIPGGRLEPGETPEDAVRREAWEEAGATLGPLTFMGHFLMTPVLPPGSPPAPTRHAAMYFADVTDVRERPAGFEALGVAFCPPDELPTRYYRWDALLAALFQRALSTKSGGDWSF